MLDAVAARAKSHPALYGHWYIDGGEAAACDPSLACISCQALEPARAAILRKIETEISRPGMGPESLRTILAQIGPADLALPAAGTGRPQNAVLERFEIRPADGRIRHADFQHCVRAVGRSGSAASRAAADFTGALRPAPAAEADERTTDHGIGQFRTRLARLSGRCWVYGSLTTTGSISSACLAQSTHLLLSGLKGITGPLPIGSLHASRHRAQTSPASLAQLLEWAA